MKKNLFSGLPIVVFLILSGFKCPSPAYAPPDKPNVLIIMVDDMNKWSVLKDYPVLEVPAIDKLIGESRLFTNASCAAPVCIPSRASFFSGKFPHHSGVYRNSQDVWRRSPVLVGAEAMPELFKRNGYTTWAGGKTFHLRLPGTREQEMFDNEVVHGGFGPFYEKGNWFKIKPWEGPDSDFTDVVNANAAMAFLAQEHDKPFFMYYGLYRPHTPYTAPKRFFEMYDGVRFPHPPGYLESDLDDVPEPGLALSDGMKQLTSEGLSKEEALQTYLKAYCANTSFADWNVGRVLEALDKSAYAKNTIVIFASDNGFHNGTKNHWTKSTLWEQADAVPLLIRLPDRKAYRCTQPVTLVDIYPTLIEYCGLTAPGQKLDGRSLVPILNNPKITWHRPALTTYGEQYTSVRSERYRYIRYPDQSEELYDHQNDPYEHVNLAGNANMEGVKAGLSKFIPEHFQQSVAAKKTKGKDAGGKKKAKKKGGAKKSIR